MALKKPRLQWSREQFLLSDYLILAYGLLLIVVGVLFFNRLPNAQLWLSTDCALLLLFYMILERNRREPTAFYTFLHFAFPLFTYGFFYTQSALWDNLVFPQTFDQLLRRWDQALFGAHLHQLLAPALDNVLFDELMHGFYFAYYVVVFLPAILMFLSRNHRAFEMVFTATLMYYVHYLFFMFFPADGPIPERAHLFQNGYVFIPIMDAIYHYSGQQGGGAFPSTHVSLAVIIGIYTYRYFKPIRTLIVVLCAGIIVATVYCSYHYAVDSLAGLITGIIFYFFGSWLYRRLRPEPEAAFVEYKTALTEATKPTF